ncbi:MAG: electron transfer flavoprotein subunit beta [Armatimonadetes bacterium]|nr:electron transfer flavoprotein subunit beta [Armatimonadota bacterium]
MRIAVLLNMVPDLVEELEIDSTGKALDTQWMRYVISESDDHALEQALLLKDRHGASVSVLAMDYGDADQVLYAALARGADEAVNLTGIPETGLGKRAAAATFKEALGGIRPDLILAGVQAIDDLDAHVAGMLGGMMALPYVGVTRSVEPSGEGKVLVQKEYPGGAAAEIEVTLPAVVGVLSAPQPPRYVPVARIREVMKTRTLDKREAVAVAVPAEPAVIRLFKPEPAEHAQMLDGSPEELAGQIIKILEDRGLAP